MRLNRVRPLRTPYSILLSLTGQDKLECDSSKTRSPVERRADEPNSLTTHDEHIGKKEKKRCHDRRLATGRNLGLGCSPAVSCIYSAQYGLTSLSKNILKGLAGCEVESGLFPLGFFCFLFFYEPQAGKGSKKRGGTGHGAHLPCF